MDAKTREKAITQTSIIGILANIFLSAFKAVAGLVAGSIAIVLDAVNNLTDAMSSVITIVGIKLAHKAPDDDHPFGHGRIEYFSTILIALIIAFAGATSMIESVKKILSPQVPDYSLVTIVIVVASVLVKLILGRFVKKQGEKYNSDSLIASGEDASFDAIISASTLLGAIVTFFFHISIDGFIGAVISVFILKAAVEMFMESIGSVIGNRPDSEVTKSIKKDIASLDQVQGAYDLILHNYGPDSAIGSVHVEVPAEMTLREFHVLTIHIQQMIWQKYHIFMTVGAYGVDSNNPAWKVKRVRINELCKAHEGVINTHGVYVNDEEKYISFDVMTSFDVKDKKALFETIVREVGEEYPGYTVKPKFDTNYSD